MKVDVLFPNKDCFSYSRPFKLSKNKSDSISITLLGNFKSTIQKEVILPSFAGKNMYNKIAMMVNKQGNVQTNRIG